jgi:DNA-binding NarL/FixJ family response regulator
MDGRNKERKDSNMSTRIAIVDNDAIFCMGLRLIIEEQQNMEFVGEFRKGETAFHQIRELSPDIVFTDIDTFHLKSTHLAQQITSALPGIKVIALLIQFNEYFISRLFTSINAAGYLLKNSSFEDIITAIDTVKNNEFYLGNEIEKLIFKAAPVNSCNNVDMICNTEAPEFVGSDSKVILELWKIFMDKAPRLLESLKEAIDTDNPDLAGDHAYSLKIASSVIGAYSLKEKASRVELIARHSNLENIHPFYEDLEDTFRKKLNEFEARQCQNCLE